MARQSTPSPRERFREVQEAYAHGHDRPLAGYAALIAANVALAAALGTAARRSDLFGEVSTRDLVLVTLATHKLSRIIAKESVTSPIRAPFTRYEGVSGPAELHEEVRGEGMRHAVGELISCPFCVGEWVATLLVHGLALAPRATRTVASVFAVLAGSDALQFAYARLEQST